MISIPLLICIALGPLAISNQFQNPILDPKWGLIYVATLFTLGQWLALGKSIRIPNLPRSMWWLIILFCISAGLATLLHPWNWEHWLLHWMIFGALSLLGFNWACRVEKSKILPIATGIGAVFCFLIGPENSFGIPGFAAQYLGICVILQLSLLQQAYQNRYRLTLVVLGILLVGCLAYMIIHKTRGPAFSFFVTLFFWLTSQRKISKRAGFFGLALVLAGFLVWTQVSTSSELKTQNARLRFARWLNTGAMILENPLGVGPNQYSFSYLRYKKRIAHDTEPSEDILVKFPHNQFLELAAEYGVLTLVFFISILFIFIRFSLKINPHSLWVLIFVTIEGLFSSPLRNPPVFLLTAVTFGMFIRELFSSHKVSQKGMAPWPRILLVTTLCLVGVLGFRQSYAAYLTANSRSEDYSSVNKACQMGTNFWEACIMRARLDLIEGRFQFAEDTLKKILHFSPGHFIAKRDLVYTLVAQDKKSEACYWMRDYDSTFDQVSSFKPFLHRCAKIILESQKSHFP